MVGYSRPDEPVMNVSANLGAGSGAVDKIQSHENVMHRDTTGSEGFFGSSPNQALGMLICKLKSELIQYSDGQ